ncbi:protein FAR1-RELATED SEQUENCE 4-like [Lycium barbarum]|uniref:protein FAR1-RELATED SEQUENCE 4-like n=1 Tax=Lycium barbarum TaxID=112863 RepID=UPI00293EA8A9|nr:protein FAR1-RELATED SEQUENCE 4-like [Lycium barbarum]
MIKLRNPGTVANIKWTAGNKFKYAFFAYGASIEGWKHCRPVMMVNATFLKSKYRGVLMIAVAKDGNNNIFPLAFGIADSENNESYRWFFRHVKKVFGTRKDLSILSDRHASIATAIKELYPDTKHGICIYHMEKNLQKHFPSEAILSCFTMQQLPTNRQSFGKLDATRSSHDLTCWAEKILLEKISRGFTMKVENITPIKFVVKDEGYQYNVDLKNITCECLEFQTDELPCTHAMAVIDKRSLSKSTHCAD